MNFQVFISSGSILFLACLICLSGPVLALDRIQEGSEFDKFAVQLSATYTTPFDKTYSDTRAGVGFDIVLMKSFTEHFALRLNIGQSGLKLDNNPIQTDFLYMKPTTPPLPPGIIMDQNRTRLSITRFYLAAQYNSTPLDLSISDAIFYLYGGLGGAVHKTTLKTRIREDSTGYDNTSIYNKKIFRPAMTLGIGVVFPVSPKIGFDISAGSDLVYAGQSTFVGVDTSRRAYNYDGTFDLRLGLIALF